VNKSEDGKWIIDGRELSGMLASIEGDHKAIVDRKSGEVRITNEKPRPGR
jgi:hypothetical protein